jgi:large conductance mechanosensitive channel
MLVRSLSKLHKKEEAAPAGPSTTDKLLTEIRDELKRR